MEGYTEYAAGFEYSESERGITCTRVFRRDSRSHVDTGVELPEPGDVLSEEDMRGVYMAPGEVVFTGLICRERTWKALAGDPKVVEWTVSYSNDPVDTNIFDTSVDVYTPLDIQDVPMTLEFSGESVNINPVNAPGSAGWTWEGSGATVVQPIPFKVNSSNLKIGPIYISLLNYDNFMYASRYLAGRLNDTENPFEFAVGSNGGRIGSWLYHGASSEPVRNYVSDKWWRVELNFLYRSPDGLEEDGWQKILRMDGVWDKPIRTGHQYLYKYGNFKALWDQTVSPITVVP